MRDETFDWAQENFGKATLGDPRRVARLVSMAAQAARTPAGRVTEVFETSAAREGAYRLLESSAVSSGQVCEPVFDASARRASGARQIYVALDRTSLTLTDRSQKREIGTVGKRWPTRGLHVMSALGMDEQGTVLGLLDQKWWAQTAKIGRRSGKSCGSKYRERETRYWFDTLDDASRRLAERAPDATPWYQFDRGADCWPLLNLAVEQEILVTVRSCHDRRLVDRHGKRRYLRETLKKQPVLGHFDVELAANPDRPARTARIALRAAPVVIFARVSGKKWRPIQLNAVFAEETGRARDRLRWYLLTTAPIDSFRQACAVVRGYTLRWRIEEFHRVWKRGLCRVEETQLQSRAALIKWATILAAVATRALRIAQLLRTAPEAPADEEFTKYEIAAAFALAKRKLDARRRYTIKEVVDLVADLGGFANRYSGGRPGPTVLGRGLQKVQVIALALKNMDDMR